jgi:hypothetical protein
VVQPVKPAPPIASVAAKKKAGPKAGRALITKASLRSQGSAFKDDASPLDPATAVVAVKAVSAKSATADDEDDFLTDLEPPAETAASAAEAAPPTPAAAAAPVKANKIKLEAQPATLSVIHLHKCTVRKGGSA